MGSPAAPRIQPAAPEDAPVVLTRDRILDAAEALFAERGLAGTAVRDISAAVGLTPASLYNHFSGKQSLYEAVLERGVRPLVELMRSLPGRDPESENRSEIIDAIMDHLGSRPHLPRLIQHEVNTGGANLVRLSHSWVAPMIEQGIAAIRRSGSSVWDEEEYPLLIAAWLQLVLGHFTLAPMLGEIFGEDPLSPEALQRQTRFLRKLADLMMSPPLPQKPDTTDSTP